MESLKVMIDKRSHNLVYQKVQEIVAKYGVAPITALSVFILTFLNSTIGRTLRDKLAGLPPGPIPLPIIGNFHLITPPNQAPGSHKDYFNLSKIYGPIYTLYFGSNRGVVLNSPELFYEALKEKQDETANRPVLKSYEAITHGQGVAMNNGNRWRMIRTFLQTSVTNKQLGAEAEPEIMEEINSSLSSLLKRVEQGHSITDDLRQLCRRESINVLMRKIFSVRFTEDMSETYMNVQDWIRVIFEHLAQGSPSDFMPIMGLLPNAEEDHYRKVCLSMENFIDEQIAIHRKNISTKDPKDYDFVDKMIKLQADQTQKGEETLSDVDIRVVAFDAIVGGLDTSATSMEWLILILINYPQVQKKLQKLLDEVVGPDRLPTFEDEPKLEYLTAVIDELFRWKHFAPHGLPHEAAVDLELGGYKVPKGTQIFLNYYSLHMSKNHWKKPEEFRPERFMEEEYPLLKTVLHSETFFTKPEAYKFVPFGQGRRRCVGYGLGRVVIWLKAATWIHCFEWKSPNGKPVDLDTEILGITMVPKQQEAKVIPRPAARLLKPYQKTPKIVEL